MPKAEYAGVRALPGGEWARVWLVLALAVSVLLAISGERRHAAHSTSS
jgi:hypothetical protein